MLIFTLVYCQLGKVYDQQSIAWFLIQFGINITREWHICTRLRLVQLIAIRSCYLSQIALKTMLLIISSRELLHFLHCWQSAFQPISEPLPIFIHVQEKLQWPWSAISLVHSLFITLKAVLTAEWLATLAAWFTWYWAYGKAGNGNETETGNRNWKWKLELEMGTKTHQSLVQCFLHSVLSILLSNGYRTGFLWVMLGLYSCTVLCDYSF